MVVSYGCGAKDEVSDSIRRLCDCRVVILIEFPTETIAAMDNTIITAPSQPSPPVMPSGGGDVMVFSSIVLVSLAVAVALVRHAGLVLDQAAIAAAILGGCLGAIHMARRRRGARPVARKVKATKPAKTAKPAPVRSQLAPDAAKASAPVVADPATVAAVTTAKTLPPELPPGAPLSQWSSIRPGLMGPTAADLSTEELHSLVRKLGSSVEGPKATSVDPDLPAATPQAATKAPRAEPLAFPAQMDPSLRALLLDPQPGYVSSRPERGAEIAGSPLGMAVAAAIAAERMDVMLEPIQSLAERKPRHFEVSVRLKDADGQMIDASDVARVVRASGLSAGFDVLTLPRVAKVARKAQGRGRSADVFTALTGVSLAEDMFMAAAEEELTADAAPYIVMTLPQADVRTFAPVHWQAFDRLTDLGVRFALTDVVDLDMDFESLVARKFSYVKLDADTFLNGMPFGSSVLPAADICRHLSGLGLGVVIEGIADEVLLNKVQGFGARYGQGTLFGQPRPVRQDVLQSRAA